MISGDAGEDPRERWRRQLESEGLACVSGQVFVLRIVVVALIVWLAMVSIQVARNHLSIGRNHRLLLERTHEKVEAPADVEPTTEEH